MLKVVCEEARNASGRSYAREKRGTMWDTRFNSNESRERGVLVHSSGDSHPLQKANRSDRKGEDQGAEGQ